MTETNPRIRSLLRQADRTAANGKKAAAEKLYRQIIDESPDTVSAWIGLAKVVNDPSEKQTAYEQVLKLDPQYQSAPNASSLPPTEKELDDRSDTLTGTDGQEPADAGAFEKQEVQTPTSVNSTIDIDSSDVSNSLETHEQDSIQLDDHDHSMMESASSEVLYCANHPGRKTHLRCNKCGKPICSSCATPTPVGYRCPECIREHQDIFYNARAIDYVIAVVVALPLALISGILASFMSRSFFGFFLIFAGPGAGTLIGRIVLRAVGRRRGRGMPEMVAGLVAFGGIVMALPMLIPLFFGQPSRIIGLVFMGIYILGSSSATYYQMK
jgi:hypothetical protein